MLHYRNILVTAMTLALTACGSASASSTLCEGEDAQELGAEDYNAGAGGGPWGDGVDAGPSAPSEYSFTIGTEYGETVVIPKPAWVSIITLREVTAPVPSEGAHLRLVYPTYPGGTAGIWWVIMRETHVGNRSIASFGNGGSDATSDNPSEGADAAFVFSGGRWHLGEYSGAVLPGPDAP